MDFWQHILKIASYPKNDRQENYSWRIIFVQQEQSPHFLCNGRVRWPHVEHQTDPRGQNLPKTPATGGFHSSLWLPPQLPAWRRSRGIWAFHNQGSVTTKSVGIRIKSDFQTPCTGPCTKPHRFYWFFFPIVVMTIVWIMIVTELSKTLVFQCHSLKKIIINKRESFFTNEAV